MHSGGPELAGKTYVMTCTAGVWTESTINPVTQDDTPNAFTFTDVTGQAWNSVIASNTVTIAGIGPSPVAVSVTGAGSPQININGAGWVTSGTISAGQSLQVRLTSANAATTLRSATVTVGTVSDQWDVTTNANTCPTIGDTCSDGTIYAGLTPDGNVPMYAMPTDGPAGGYAVAPIGGYTWNDGSTNYVDTAMVNCTSASDTATSCNTGRANTTLLAAITGASPAPYRAAQYCENLTSNGYSDWYLPAQNELKLLYNLHVAGKGGFVADYYWSSSEYNDGLAWRQYFPSGNQFYSGKSAGFRVRCVRR